MIKVNPIKNKDQHNKIFEGYQNILNPNQSVKKFIVPYANNNDNNF